MKKLLLNIFLSTILFATISTSTLAFYADVDTNHPYFKAIETLYTEQKLPDAENFKPDEMVNFSDFNAILSKYTNTEITTPPSAKNTKVSLSKALDALLKIPTIKTEYLKTLKPTHKRITKGELANYLYQIENYTPAIQQNQTKQTPISVTITTNGKYTSAEQQLLDNNEFKKLMDIWSIVQSEYLYKETTENKILIDGAIKGFVEELTNTDTYTNYQSAEESKSLTDTLSGEYEGIGMSVDTIDNNVTIISPLKDSPAEKAGLKPNDVIKEVDEENVLGKPLLYVIAKIKGPAETNVKLTILRDNIEIKFTIKRTLILRTSVQYEMKKNGTKPVGYINVINFGEKTYKEFVDAANSIIKANPVGIIIDLRNNPGGYLETAVNIVGLFDKTIRTAAKLQYANGRIVEYETSGNGLLTDYKIVLLVNEGSASASEILAGALQDLNKATIIGQYTFGKGTAQQLKQFNDGAIFKYTNAKWLTPNGRDIDKKGIRPNIIVNNSTNADLQLETALSQF